MRDRSTAGNVLIADLAALAEVEGLPWPSIRSWLALLVHPGAWAVATFRLGSTLHAAGLRPFSRLLYVLGSVIFGSEFSPGARVGGGLAVPHPAGTGFGTDVVIGARVRLYSGVRLGAGGMEDASLDGMPTIGDDVWVFPGAKVFGPITIGDRARVGANAWVTRDVPPDTTVVGAPARPRRD